MWFVPTSKIFSLVSPEAMEDPATAATNESVKPEKVISAFFIVTLIILACRPLTDYNLNLACRDKDE